jgi:hypothetical protein
MLTSGAVGTPIFDDTEGSIDEHHSLLLPSRRKSSASDHDHTAVRFFSDKSYYTGEWDSTKSQPHGQGILTLHNGDRYEGSFQHGLFHGMGLFLRVARRYTPVAQSWWRFRKRTIPTPETPPPVLVGDEVGMYAGEWIRGRQHGKGTQEWRTGERYTGEFDCGWPRGRGMLIKKGGEAYHGEWIEGKRVFEGEGGYLFDPNSGGGGDYRGNSRIWSRRLWIAVVVMFVLTLVLTTQVLKL